MTAQRRQFIAKLTKFSDISYDCGAYPGDFDPGNYDPGYGALLDKVTATTADLMKFYDNVMEPKRRKRKAGKR